MPSVLDPRPIDPQARLMLKLREMESRLSNLERTTNALPVVTAAPSAASQDGQLVGDSGNVRLWLRLNGTWRYAPLT